MRNGGYDGTLKDAIAEEAASLFTSMDNPQRFLVHDINFHRLIAAASSNPIARRPMNEHLLKSRAYQAQEPTLPAGKPSPRRRAAGR